MSLVTWVEITLTFPPNFKEAKSTIDSKEVAQYLSCPWLKAFSQVLIVFLINFSSSESGLTLNESHMSCNLFDEKGNVSAI